MEDLRVLDDPVAVTTALDPMRWAILEAAREPASAATIADRIGSTRQKVNYHLRALEAHGLVELAEERTWGGITERLMRRTARCLVASPTVVDRVPIDPSETVDRRSAAYLIAVNARTVSEVGEASARAAAGGVRFPTLSIDTVVGFASSEDRATFTAELQEAITTLAARYHHDDGRPHRLTISSYPRPEESR